MPADPPSRLADAAVPLDTTDPRTGGGGLDAIADAVADTAVVGLGEATHGTREFFELKHRIVLRLVEEHGLRMFAIEAPFAETLAVDDYVRGADANAADVIGQMGFWTWSTESVREFVDWLRAFNDGRPADDQVRFFGYDVQDVAGSVDALADYVASAEPTDSAPSEAVQDGLGELADGLPHGDEEAMADAVETLESVAPAVSAHLEDHRSEYVGANGTEAHRVARQHATVLTQAAEFWRAFQDGDEGLPPTALRVRDRAMAENVGGLLERSPHDQVAVWAHNGHVKRGRQDWLDADVPAMGDHLHDRFGDDYYALGFDFQHGDFHALDASDDARRLREFTVAAEEVRENSLASDLAATGHERAFLDLGVARDAGLDDWLAAEHPVRSIGGSFSHETSDDYWETYDLERAFDGVVFVAETSASRPLDVEPVQRVRGDAE